MVKISFPSGLENEENIEDSNSEKYRIFNG